ncbi:MAG: hypothetical protein Q9208_001951 [Pyrenodesmia sp. 3 TL-2023]
MGNAASQLEPLPPIRKGLTADQARRINSLRLHSPSKSGPSQRSKEFMVEDSIRLASDLDTADLDPNARTLLDEYEMHGNNQKDVTIESYVFPEHSKRDKGTRTYLVQEPSTSWRSKTYHGPLDLRDADVRAEKQHLDPTTLKSINQFARRHVFFTDQSFQTYTTSQRRTFERAVYDYARSIGLSKAQAEASRIYARRLCGEEEYNSDDSRLDEDEIDDSAALLKQPSTGAKAPASNDTTNRVSNQEHSGDASEVQIEKEVQALGNTTSSVNSLAEVQCAGKDEAAAATMTPAIPALRHQPLVDEPGDDAPKELSRKADNALPLTATDHLLAPETSINAAASVGSEGGNAEKEHLEANGSTEDIVERDSKLMTSADGSKTSRSEHLSTASDGVPAASDIRGDAAAMKESLAPLTLGAAEKSKANAQDPGDDQRLDQTAYQQTQPQLELGSQGNKSNYTAPTASQENSITMVNEVHASKEAQEAATNSQPKSETSLQVIERPFEKYSRIGNAWQLATPANRTEPEPKADAKMHDQSESSDSGDSLSSDSQGSTDDGSSEGEQPDAALHSRTNRVTQAAEEAAEEDDESGESGDSEEGSEEVDDEQSEDDSDASEDTSKSEEDEHPEQDENGKKNVLVQKWLRGASTGATRTKSDRCNICREGPFSIAGQLRKHMKTHPRNVRCGTCNRRFKSHEGRRSHSEAIHQAPQIAQKKRKREETNESNVEKQKKKIKSEVRSSTGQLTPSESSQEGDHETITNSRYSLMSSAHARI